MSFRKDVLCIGAGYVGGPTMAVIAQKCPDYKITVVDINPDRIAAWQTDDLPIYEPGLLEVVKSCRGRNLFFSTDTASAIRAADIIFVSVNTPTKTFGEGAGMASNLQYWEQTAHEIVRNADRDKIIVEKSTLPVRTAEAMERILKANDKGLHFDVLSNPEFLAEGTAVTDLLEPDRILIGGHPHERGQKAVEELVTLFAHWVPRERIITTNLWSSEMSKLVANAFLAQRISSINAISALCEKTDADVSEIARAIGSDRRIGSRFLQASVGFGGSCFRKDILNLVYIAKSYGLEEVADYWHAVIRMNDFQKKRFVHRMLTEMFNTISGKRVAVFGFAFKADTGDTRDSAAITIVENLLEEHAQVRITDPKALDNARLDLAENPLLSFHTDPYEAARDCHAIAVATEWPEYRSLDFGRIFAAMHKPAFIFDGRNILDHQALFQLGFNVYPLGKPALTHLS
jgi:UDPglucose 6-dehydrogenase